MRSKPSSNIQAIPCRPVVYLGPSFSAAEALAIVPDALLREPIRRGDLYRARHAGESLFLVIDGLFQQEEAISPREVVDVLSDGARVLGASSMGALRAAECWPAGMRGIGVIYRLFRQGKLRSDDEVAVVCHSECDYQAVSVALVDVRWALRQASRAGLISPQKASELVRVANETFYPDREWRNIFSMAGVLNQELMEFCMRLSLKRRDAAHALRVLASERPALSTAMPDASVSRRIASIGRDPIRERSFDAMAGRRYDEARLALFDWLMGSGRVSRHILTFIASSISQLPRPQELRAHLIRSLAEQCVPLGFRTRDSYFHILEILLSDAASASQLLWAKLEGSGELQAELMREGAIASAARSAERLGLSARASDRFLAEREIAFAHGHFSWESLTASASGQLRKLVDVARRKLAMAKRFRAHLFQPNSTRACLQLGEFCARTDQNQTENTRR